MPSELVSAPLWTPSDAMIASANITAFYRKLGVGSYAELTAAVASDVRPFSRAIVDEFGLTWDRPYDELLDLSRGKPFARWFSGAGFNGPANCLDRWIGRGRGSETAVIYEGEDGEVRSYTWIEFRALVCRIANALRTIGVVKGDSVGIYLPLLPETAASLLAIGYIGAIAVPSFSGYGESALAARLEDSQAKVLITADGFTRRSKPVFMKQTADRALEMAPCVQSVLVYRRLHLAVPMTAGRDHDWDELVGSQPSEASYERTDANDPFMVLYTSGSTGKAKGAVHVHAGFMLKSMIDQHLCFDVRPGDRMLWFTDMGWMMGPFLVLGALGLGSAIVLFDGTPDFPGPDRLWKVVDRHRVTHLGLAPTAVRALVAHGDEPPAKYEMEALRILGSSGEPWNTEPYQWFLRNVGRNRAPIINYSGGTEIGGGILGTLPTLPLAANCFHGPCPGMVADVVDPSGKSVRGEVGELAVRDPWIGKTDSFWKSAAQRDDDRYLAAYWERIPGLWIHGDWAVADPSTSTSPEYWYIRGRSDDTINVAGKRVGPAEFESAMVSHPAVVEAAAIAIPDDIKGDVVVCLIVAKSRAAESDNLRKELFEIIDHSMGKSLRPKAIRFVDELPKTRNGKVMRRIARARFLGLPDLGDLTALENHSALDAIDAAR